MGCVGSRQDSQKKRKRSVEIEEQSNCRTNATNANRNASETIKGHKDESTPVHMQPKISMMSDHTLKLLKEIGELKAFTEIDPAESKQKMNKHLDILMALENPQAAMSGGTATAKTRST